VRLVVDDDEADDDDHSDGHHSQGKTPVRIFTGKWMKTPVITGPFIQLVTPPRGKARWMPFLVYQPQRKSRFEIATRRRVNAKGILVVNGSISRLRNNAFQRGTLELTVNKKIIRKIYQKYSVNEAPVIIRNLRIYSRMMHAIQRQPPCKFNRFNGQRNRAKQKGSASILFTWMFPRRPLPLPI